MLQQTPVSSLHRGRHVVYRPAHGVVSAEWSCTLTYWPQQSHTTTTHMLYAVSLPTHACLTNINLSIYLSTDLSALMLNVPRVKQPGPYCNAIMRSNAPVRSWAIDTAASLRAMQSDQHDH